MVAFGRDPSDVPSTSQVILQIVPLEYGIKISLQAALVQLTDALITQNIEQNSLFIKGQRAAVLRALELIDMLDVPAARGRYIGMINLDYVSPEEFSTEVGVLLSTEGLTTSVGAEGTRNVVMVPLEKLGAVAVFAATQSLLDRVKYWATLVDVAGGGTNRQYFFYQPKYARAKDVGDSVSTLITGSSAFSESGVARPRAAEEKTGSAPSDSRSSGVQTEEMKMVIDERSNALIFYTTGSQYRALKPLLAKLDVVPKQVALEIIIAEVSLKDEFKFGVEWAVSRGEVNLTTQGAFGATSVGGIGLLVNGKEGPLTANFINTSSLIKVLSRPTLTVRDGVSAQINVGSDISVVGSTTQDPISGDRQTTTSEYRKTGVDVTVTPTVNAAGIVVIEVSQTISNSLPDAGASGNPDIFERSLQTEVVARSGQTILLGGLISESSSVGDSSAPILGSIPLIGNLFKSGGDGGDRTELVMLITPRVLDDIGEWDSVKDDFRKGLKYLNFGQLDSE